jgi:hypothetical protein
MDTAVAVLSGVIIAAVLAAVGASAGVGGALIAGAVGVALGSTFGIAIKRARPYDASKRGVWRFVVDHTWSLPNTVAGALYLAVNLVFRNSLNPSATPGTGSIVLTKGVFPGYATTIGTVQAGTNIGTTQERHELIHVFQARLFGPLYLPSVIANYVVATILPYWLLYYDKQRWPVTSLGSYFMMGVYPHTWHEGWAYSVAK